MANKREQKRMLSKFIQVFLTTFALLMIVIAIGTVIYVVVSEKSIKKSGSLFSWRQKSSLAGFGDVRLGIQLRYHRDYVDYLHPVCFRDEVHVAPLDVGIFNGGFFPELYG